MHNQMNMIKVVKKHIKQAILLYVDPDTGIYRRVVFGDPKETLNFFIDNVQILLSRFEGIYQKGDPKEVKNAKDFLDVINQTRRPWEKKNYADFSDDNMEMNLTYEVKKTTK